MKKKIFYIILVSQFIFFLTFFIILLKHLLLGGKKVVGEIDERNHQDRKFSFQYLFMESDIHELTSGIVTLSNHDMEEEYISYEDENGNYHLLSKFGSTEYECTGFCSCTPTEENVIDEGRRSVITTNTVVKRSLYYLLAASTSFLAYDLAKKHFEEECENQCHHHQHHLVLSEVDGCRPVDLKRGEKLTEESVQEGKELRKFWCTGNCLNRKKVKPVNKPSKEILEYYDKLLEYPCSDLSTSAEVVLECEKENKIWFPTGVEVMDLAKLRFLQEILHDFCSENSRVHETIESVDHQNTGKAQTFEVKHPACVSGGVNDNDSIFCRRMWNQD